MNWRRTLVGSCVVLSLVATGCLGDDSGSGSSQPDDSSATDDTSTPSSDDTTAASSDDTTAGTDDTAATDDTTAPEDTTATTEATSTTARPRKLYEELPQPELPDERTPPVPSKGSLPDGTYWATYTGGDGTGAGVDVVQAFFGAACEAKAAELGTECLNGILVVDTPTRSLTLPFGDGVVITVSHESTQKSYFVTPEELVNVVAGNPSPKAPAGYSYVGFAFLMRVRSGKITRFRQVWTP